MAKDPHDRIREQGDKVRSRLGNTTGASKGGKPAPKPKLTPRVRRKSIGAKVEVKF